jgi:Family of unknown function (DUF5336)
MTQPYSDAPAPGPEPTPSPTPHGRTGPAIPDLRTLQPFDLGILIAGVLIFIVSFFPWFGVSSSGASVGGFKVPGVNASENAWHSYSVLALLLLLLATAVAAVAIFAASSAPELPVGLRWIAAALSSLGGLLYVIRVLTLPHHSTGIAGFKASEGAKWGAWVLLIVVLVHVACAVISALSSDEQVPWQRGASTAPPAA